MSASPRAEGRVVFLTGASSGLGEALAPLLARDGDRICVTARRAENLEALAGRIREAGGTALPLSLDVGDHDAVLAAFARCEAELGPVDLLICNAGIGDPTPVANFKAADVERIFRTNVLGVANCVEAVLPGMLERRAGHIVGVSSLAGYRGLPGTGAYASSKAALTNLLESLRVELRSYDVAVTTICPGFVKTPMTARNRFPMPFLMELEDAAQAMYEGIRARDTHVAFPWQLASIVKASRILPDALYDRALKGRSVKKSPRA